MLAIPTAKGYEPTTPSSFDISARIKLLVPLETNAVIDKAIQVLDYSSSTDLSTLCFPKEAVSDVCEIFITIIK